MQQKTSSIFIYTANIGLYFQEHTLQGKDIRIPIPGAKHILHAVQWNGHAWFATLWDVSLKLFCIPNFGYKLPGQSRPLPGIISRLSTTKWRKNWWREVGPKDLHINLYQLRPLPTPKSGDRANIRLWNSFNIYIFLILYCK